MFKLHAIQAAFGDSLLLEYGTAAAPRFILVDGGPPDTFQPHLRKVLNAIVRPAGGRLDQVILSHVDNDHVIGLLDLFAELRRQRDNGETPLVTVGGLWHNSFARTLDPAGTLQPRLAGILARPGVAGAMDHAAIAINGIGEGSRLRQFALALGIPLNANIPDPITVDQAATPILLGNLTLTVVGPTEANLAALRDKWEKWLDENEPLLAMADAQVLANLDKSVPNLSSICLVATVGGKSILLTGDARSDHLYAGLKMRRLVDNFGRAHFDVIKVPHHGSDRNITRRFFEQVTADCYVISANGKDDNPDLPTLLWLVDAAKKQGRAVEIVVTNQTESTRELKRIRPPAEFGYTLRFPKSGTSSVEIVLQA